jgi:hypothetical protein
MNLKSYFNKYNNSIIKPMIESNKFDWYVIDKGAIAVEVGIGKNERASHFFINKCAYDLINEIKNVFKDINKVYLNVININESNAHSVIQACVDNNIDIEFINSAYSVK